MVCLTLSASEEKLQMLVLCDPLLIELPVQSSLYYYSCVYTTFTNAVCIKDIFALKFLEV